MFHFPLYRLATNRTVTRGIGVGVDDRLHVLHGAMRSVDASIVYNDETHTLKAQLSAPTH